MTPENKVINRAKLLSMKWREPGLPTDQLFAAVEELHVAVCEFYGVDPKIGFRMTSDTPA